jgi:flavin reductase (DIM6/NTAB) family NADH-FMN oxidoreductase RutF
MSRRSLAPADRAAPAPLDEEMRAALRQVPASVAIVTTGRAEAALGMTATSVTSVSLAPPALLVCVNRVLRLNAAMRANGRFQISYLRRGQEDVARAFAGAVSGFERFGVGDWNLDAPAGAELPSALIGVSCRLETSLEYGSHSVFIGLVEAVRRSAGEPLLYCGGLYSP